MKHKIIEDSVDLNGQKLILQTGKLARAATTSIFRKGRKFVFMVHSAAEVYLEGLIDIAAKRVNQVIAANGQSVAVTGGNPDREFRARNFKA